MQLARQCVSKAPTGTPLVAFVGPVCRTHRVDIDWIYLVMEILKEARVYRPVRGGMFGFDHWIGVCGEHVGLRGVMAGPEDRDTQLDENYRRPLDLLEGVCLVVAFPREDPPHLEGVKAKAPRDYPVDTADTEVVGLARALELPLLVVRRSGKTEWIGR